MNKFGVNTHGVEGVGIVKVNGGKVYCTVDEFINMHSAECIEENDDTLYYFRNEVVEEIGYPIGKGSLGSHHSSTFVEGENTFVPMWEGQEFICYVDLEKQEVSNLSEIINGELYTKDVYEVDFNFFIETWEENRFYPRKPI